MSNEESIRRPACIIMNATTGDVRAAKTVFTRVVREVLGAGYREAPWYCGYYGPRDLDRGESPRWTLDLTDAEFSTLMNVLSSAYKADEWTGVPLDCYHD